MSRERSPPSGHAKIVLAAVVFGVRRAASGIFEDQDAVGRRLGWVPRLVEPVQIRVVIGDLLFDRLPSNKCRALASRGRIDPRGNKPTQLGRHLHR